MNLFGNFVVAVVFFLVFLWIGIGCSTDNETNMNLKLKQLNKVGFMSPG